MNVWIFIVFRYWLKTLDPDDASDSAEHRPERGSKPMREGREVRRPSAAAPQAGAQAVRRALRAGPAHEPDTDIRPPATAAATRRRSARIFPLRRLRPCRDRFRWSGRPNSRAQRVRRRIPHRSGVRRSIRRHARIRSRPGQLPCASPSSPHSGTRARDRRGLPPSPDRRPAATALCIVSFSWIRFRPAHSSTIPHSRSFEAQLSASRRAVASSTP